MIKEFTSKIFVAILLCVLCALPAQGANERYFEDVYIHGGFAGGGMDLLSNGNLKFNGNMYMKGDRLIWGENKNVLFNTTSYPNGLWLFPNNVPKLRIGTSDLGAQTNGAEVWMAGYGKLTHLGGGIDINGPITFEDQITMNGGSVIPTDHPSYSQNVETHSWNRVIFDTDAQVIDFFRSPSVKEIIMGNSGTDIGTNFRFGNLIIDTKENSFQTSSADDVNLFTQPAELEGLIDRYAVNVNIGAPSKWVEVQGNLRILGNIDLRGDIVPGGGFDGLGSGTGTGGSGSSIPTILTGMAEIRFDDERAIMWNDTAGYVFLFSHVYGPSQWASGTMFDGPKLGSLIDTDSRSSILLGNSSNVAISGPGLLTKIIGDLDVAGTNTTIEHNMIVQGTTTLSGSLSELGNIDFDSMTDHISWNNQTTLTGYGFSGIPAVNTGLEEQPLLTESGAYSSPVDTGMSSDFNITKVDDPFNLMTGASKIILDQAPYDLFQSHYKTAAEETISSIMAPGTVFTVGNEGRNITFLPYANSKLLITGRDRVENVTGADIVEEVIAKDSTVGTWLSPYDFVQRTTTDARYEGPRKIEMGNYTTSITLGNDLTYDTDVNLNGSLELAKYQVEGAASNLDPLAKYSTKTISDLAMKYGAITSSTGTTYKYAYQTNTSNWIQKFPLLFAIFFTLPETSTNNRLLKTNDQVLINAGTTLHEVSEGSRYEALVMDYLPSISTYPLMVGDDVLVNGRKIGTVKYFTPEGLFSSAVAGGRKLTIESNEVFEKTGTGGGAVDRSIGYRLAFNNGSAESPEYRVAQKEEDNSAFMRCYKVVLNTSLYSFAGAAIRTGAGGVFGAGPEVVIESGTGASSGTSNTWILQLLKGEADDDPIGVGSTLKLGYSYNVIFNNAFTTGEVPTVGQTVYFNQYGAITPITPIGFVTAVDSPNKTVTIYVNRSLTGSLFYKIRFGNAPNATDYACHSAFTYNTGVSNKPANGYVVTFSGTNFPSISSGYLYYSTNSGSTWDADMGNALVYDSVSGTSKKLLLKLKPDKTIAIGANNRIKFGSAGTVFTFSSANVTSADAGTYTTKVATLPSVPATTPYYGNQIWYSTTSGGTYKLIGKISGWDATNKKLYYEAISTTSEENGKYIKYGADVNNLSAYVTVTTFATTTNFLSAVPSEISGNVSATVSSYCEYNDFVKFASNPGTVVATDELKLTYFGDMYGRANGTVATGNKVLVSDYGVLSRVPAVKDQIYFGKVTQAPASSKICTITDRKFVLGKVKSVETSGGHTYVTVKHSTPLTSGAGGDFATKIPAHPSLSFIRPSTGATVNTASVSAQTYPAAPDYLKLDFASVLNPIPAANDIIVSDSDAFYKDERSQVLFTLNKTSADAALNVAVCKEFRNYSDAGMPVKGLLSSAASLNATSIAVNKFDTSSDVPAIGDYVYVDTKDTLTTRPYRITNKSGTYSNNTSVITFTITPGLGAAASAGAPLFVVPAAKVFTQVTNPVQLALNSPMVVIGQKDADGSDSRTNIRSMIEMDNPKIVSPDSNPNYPTNLAIGELWPQVTGDIHIGNRAALSPQQNVRVEGRSVQAGATAGSTYTDMKLYSDTPGAAEIASLATTIGIGEDATSASTVDVATASTGSTHNGTGGATINLGKANEALVTIGGDVQFKSTSTNNVLNMDMASATDYPANATLFGNISGDGGAIEYRIGPVKPTLFDYGRTCFVNTSMTGDLSVYGRTELGQAADTNANDTTVFGGQVEISRWQSDSEYVRGASFDTIGDTYMRVNGGAEEAALHGAARVSLFSPSVSGRGNYTALIVGGGAGGTYLGGEFNYDSHYQDLEDYNNPIVYLGLGAASIYIGGDGYTNPADGSAVRTDTFSENTVLFDGYPTPSSYASTTFNKQSDKLAGQFTLSNAAMYIEGSYSNGIGLDIGGGGLLVEGINTTNKKAGSFTGAGYVDIARATAGDYPNLSLKTTGYALFGSGVRASDNLGLQNYGYLSVLGSKTTTAYAIEATSGGLNIGKAANGYSIYGTGAGYFGDVSGKSIEASGYVNAGKNSSGQSFVGTGSGEFGANSNGYALVASGKGSITSDATIGGNLTVQGTYLDMTSSGSTIRMSKGSGDLGEIFTVDPTGAHTNGDQAVKLLSSANQGVSLGQSFDVSNNGLYVKTGDLIADGNVSSSIFPTAGVINIGSTVAESGTYLHGLQTSSSPSTAGTSTISLHTARGTLNLDASVLDMTINTGQAGTDRLMLSSNQDTLKLFPHTDAIDIGALAPTYNENGQITSGLVRTGLLDAEGLSTKNLLAWNVSSDGILSGVQGIFAPVLGSNSFISQGLQTQTTVLSPGYEAPNNIMYVGQRYRVTQLPVGVSAFTDTDLTAHSYGSTFWATQASVDAFDALKTDQYASSYRFEWAEAPQDILVAANLAMKPAGTHGSNEDNGYQPWGYTFSNDTQAGTFVISRATPDYENRISGLMSLNNGRQTGSDFMIFGLNSGNTQEEYEAEFQTALNSTIFTAKGHSTGFESKFNIVSPSYLWIFPSEYYETASYFRTEEEGKDKEIGDTGDSLLTQLLATVNAQIALISGKSDEELDSPCDCDENHLDKTWREQLAELENMRDLITDLVDKYQQISDKMLNERGRSIAKDFSGIDFNDISLGYDSNVGVRMNTVGNTSSIYTAAVSVDTITGSDIQYEFDENFEPTTVENTGRLTTVAGVDLDGISGGKYRYGVRVGDVTSDAYKRDLDAAVVTEEDDYEGSITIDPNATQPYDLHYSVKTSEHGKVRFGDKVEMLGTEIQVNYDELPKEEPSGRRNKGMVWIDTASDNTIKVAKGVAAPTPVLDYVVTEESDPTSALQITFTDNSEISIDTENGAHDDAVRGNYFVFMPDHINGGSETIIGTLLDSNMHSPQAFNFGSYQTATNRNAAGGVSVNYAIWQKVEGKDRKAYLNWTLTKPTADFIATSVTEGVLPLEVTFHDRSSTGSLPIKTWDWKPFGTSLDAQQNTTNADFVYTYNVSDVNTYLGQTMGDDPVLVPVTLKVASLVNEDTMTRANYIRILPSVQILLGLLGQLTGDIEGGQFTLSLTPQVLNEKATYKDTFLTVYWDFGDGVTSTPNVAPPGTATHSYDVDDVLGKDDIYITLRIDEPLSDDPPGYTELTMPLETLPHITVTDISGEGEGEGEVVLTFTNDSEENMLENQHYVWTAGGQELTEESGDVTYQATIASLHDPDNPIEISLAASTGTPIGEGEGEGEYTLSTRTETLEITPIPEFKATGNTPGSGVFTVAFSNDTSHDVFAISSTEWVWGDGSSNGSGLTPTHEYADSILGTDAQVQMTSNTAYSHVHKTKYLEAHPDFTAAVEDGEAGAKVVTFTNDTVRGVADTDNWKWVFGDGSAPVTIAGTESGDTEYTYTPDHFRADPNTATIQVSLESEDIINHVTKTYDVEPTAIIHTPVSYEAEETDPQNPDKKAATFTFASDSTTGIGGTLTYAWDFDGDSVVDSTSATPSFLYTSDNDGIFNENYSNMTLTVSNAISSHTVTKSLVPSITLYAEGHDATSLDSTYDNVESEIIPTTQILYSVVKVSRIANILTGALEFDVGEMPEPPSVLNLTEDDFDGSFSDVALMLINITPAGIIEDFKTPLQNPGWPIFTDASDIINDPSENTFTITFTNCDPSMVIYVAYPSADPHVDVPYSIAGTNRLWYKDAVLQNTYLIDNPASLTQSFEFTTSGDHSVTQTIQCPSNGYTYEAESTVNFFIDEPLINFTANGEGGEGEGEGEGERVLYGAIPFEVTFANTSSEPDEGVLEDDKIHFTPNVKAWDWNFGDGATHETTEDAVHTYTDKVEGGYSVILTGTNQIGDYEANTFVIHPMYAPQAAFTPATLTGVEIGHDVQFTDTSTYDVEDVGEIGHHTWSWDFGVGEGEGEGEGEDPTSTDQNPLHTFYGPSGYRTITFTASSDWGDDVETKEDIIAVGYLPHFIDNPEWDEDITNFALDMPMRKDHEQYTTFVSGKAVNTTAEPMEEVERIDHDIYDATYTWDFGGNINGSVPTTGLTPCGSALSGDTEELIFENVNTDTAQGNLTMTVSTIIGEVEFEDSIEPITTGVYTPETLVSVNYNTPTIQADATTIEPDDTVEFTIEHLYKYVDNGLNANALYYNPGMGEIDFDDSSAVQTVQDYNLLRDARLNDFDMAAILTAYDDMAGLNEGHEITHQFTEVGVYDVTYSASTAWSTIQNTATITCVPAPFIEITPNTSTLYVGLAEDVVFTASHSAGKTGFLTDDGVEWQWDDGSSIEVDTGAEVEHLYTTAGTYDVVATLKNNVPQSISTDPVTITVLEDFEVDFSADPQYANTPTLQVAFTDLTTHTPAVKHIAGVEQLTYDWNFGDGSAHSTDKNPTHDYDEFGVYDVTLTVTATLTNDAPEEKSITKTSYISVAELPISTPQLDLEDENPVMLGNFASGGSDPVILKLVPYAENDIFNLPKTNVVWTLTDPDTIETEINGVQAETQYDKTGTWTVQVEYDTPVGHVTSSAVEITFETLADQAIAANVAEGEDQKIHVTIGDPVTFTPSWTYTGTGIMPFTSVLGDLDVISWYWFIVDENQQTVKTQGYMNVGVPQNETPTSVDGVWEADTTGLAAGNYTVYCVIQSLESQVVALTSTGYLVLEAAE